MSYQDNSQDDEIYLQGDYSLAGSVRLKEVSSGVYAPQKLSGGAWATKSLSASDVAATTGTITTLNATTANVTNLDAGASGTAGTVDIFPATASKGKLQIAVTDQTGNTTVSLQVGAMAAARTITLADPGAAANIVTSVGVGSTQVARQSADVTKDDGAAVSALTGLSHTVQAGTYRYKAVLQLLSTANAGAQVTLELTTAVLTSIQNTAKAFTASGVAVARSTTATDGAVLYGADAAIIQIELDGTMVVSTGGTVELHGAQNSSHADETVFYAGSTFEIHRIA